jgi:two-component system sensor histidine kinase KdpD
MNETKKIIVAITSSPTSYYLIEEAKKISELLKLKLIAVHINTGKVLNNNEKKLLNRNLAKAKELNINVISTYNTDVVNGILELARREKVVKIIIGKPIYYKVSDTITEKLIKTSGDIDIYAISSIYNCNLFIFGQ